MKKKVLAAVLVAALAAMTLVGCGAKKDDTATTDTATTDTTPADDAATADDAAKNPGVFCYFGPAWLIDFCMACDQEGSVGDAGLWRVTPGPQGFYWGGTWICAANGTDNASLVADIIKTMTTDEDVLRKIIEEKSDFVNSASLIDEYRNNENFGNAYLGGQNPYGIFGDGVATVDLSNICDYDQVCNEEFQAAMKDYFTGAYATYEDALNAFYASVKTQKPELVAPGEDPVDIDVETAEIPVTTSDDGAVLNMYTWNTEFIERFVAYYPGYEGDDKGGKIGDVTVNFVTVPSDGGAYQDNLDTALAGQMDAAADDKVDIFLVEADYALKYTGTDYTLSMSDLGLDDSVFAGQYQYTKDIVTFDGQLKGASWQGCPGALIYRADIAEEVLGASDVDTVQAAVADWATFEATAAKMAEAGYMMNATVNDSYRVFSNNVTSKWVEDGVINVDSNLVTWVEMSKRMYDAGQCTAEALWGDVWSQGFYK